jgi:NADPH:quinone reductase-like Zn-dependent oxidoreductase
MKLRYKVASGILIVLLVAISSLALVLSHNSDCGPAPVVSADAELMKAITYRCYGSTDVLEFADVAKPQPADNEVLIKVVAASVNPLDWHFMRGTPYFMRLMSGLSAPNDTGVGVDFAGTVEAVGSNVTRFKPGDEVFGGGNGVFAEYVTISAGGALAMKPVNI